MKIYQSIQTIVVLLTKPCMLPIMNSILENQTVMVEYLALHISKQKNKIGMMLMNLSKLLKNRTKIN